MTFRTVLSVAFVGVTLLACVRVTPVVAGGVLDLSRLQSDAAANGWASVFGNLSKNPRQWNQLKRKVQTGDRGWVRFALKLRGYSDAHWSGELQDALADALAAAPDKALSELPDSELRTSCAVVRTQGVPYKNIEATKSAAEALKKKIAKVSEPSLREKRDACIKHVGESETDAANWFNN